ncbi:PREDICTED: protein LYK5-like [Erythranthe guttata]|nr:PREDICTED: protein LYK5-like [Erythranthe guttata]|eukprot:XP_012842711.1 PREDICTED: protein LYK5-like [Erythranthe guttata]
MAGSLKHFHKHFHNPKRRQMKTKLSNGFFFFLLLFYIKVQAQRSTVGYNCTPNQPPTSCETYVFYRATPPYFLDLASVGDLFSVSRPMISNPSNIYLRRPLSSPTTGTQPLSNKSTDKKGAILGLGIGLGICGVLIISICGTWFYRENSMKSRKYRDEEEQKMQKIGNGISKAEEVNLMADVSDCLDKYRVFGVEDLRNATNGFDDGCVIQGSVYRGCIDGEWYAIKKMKWNAYEELKILQKVNHGNLVRLEGFCIDPVESNCYLVYEHVENGSLHSWLHENKNNKKPEKLSWKTRLRIAIDIANGLQYIHEHTRPRVVHKDINSKNILLDSNMRAKIANFGLTKSGCNAITTQIVGAKGYICPEYIENGVVSTKMDVFSFGVVLLELVSGRAPVDDQGGLLWAEGGGVLEGTGKGGKLRGWMAEGLVGDETIMSSWESVVSVVAVAVACVNRDPTKRPSMVEIVYALSKSDDLFFDFSEDEFSPRQVIAR